MLKQPPSWATDMNIPLNKSKSESTLENAKNTKNDKLKKFNSHEDYY